MGVPAMYYVGCGFNWFLMLLCIGGYFYISSKTGKKLVSLLILAAAWIASGISYLLLIGGASSGEWYITLIRTIIYVLFLATILTLIVELTKGKKH